MKYIRIVDAVQWDGDPTFEGIQPDFDFYMGISTGYVFMNSHTGKYVKILPSNWIVTEEDGNKIVMSNEKFTSMFKPWYGELPVAEEMSRLYNRVTDLENEAAIAKFGGKSY